LADNKLWLKKAGGADTAIIQESSALASEAKTVLEIGIECFFSVNMNARGGKKKAQKKMSP